MVPILKHKSTMYQRPVAKLIGGESKSAGQKGELMNKLLAEVREVLDEIEMSRESVTEQAREHIN